MKRIFTFLFAFCCVLSLGDIQAQGQRIVLLEEFTNASCGPCAAQNPAFNALIERNRDKVAVIKYQTWWPGYDPMYLSNTAQVRVRTPYYGVNSVPRVLVDGTTYNGQPGGVTQNSINTRYNNATNIEIDLTHNFNAALDSVFITCTVNNVSTANIPSLYQLYVILTEREIRFPDPPGATNEKDFYDVMRQMITGASGSNLGSIAAGGSKTFDFAMPVPTNYYSIKNLSAVAFVQRNTTKQVLNAGVSDPIQLMGTFYDVSSSIAADNTDGLCDYMVDASIDFINETDDEVTEVVAAAEVDGMEIGRETFTGSLMKGDLGTIEFKDLTLNPGQVAFDIQIISVNGKPDLDKINNIHTIKNYTTVEPMPFTTRLLEDFETAPGVLPDHFYLQNNGMQVLVTDRASNTGVGAVHEMGGYAQSQFPIVFNCFPAGTPEASAFWDKIDLTNSSHARLIFDRAFAPRGSEFTRMRVYVSTDCGQTWDRLLSKQGRDLATAPAHSSLFFPEPTEWATEYIDLTAYDGTPELLVRFAIRSGSSSNLVYLDNVVVESTPTSVDNTDKEGDLLTVLSNPSREDVRLKYVASVADEAQISLQDANGTVMQTTTVKLQSGENLIDLKTDVPSGMYLLNLRQKNETHNAKVMIVR